MTATRILACGAWDLGDGYPRPRSLLAALRTMGIDLAECRTELPYTGPAKKGLAVRPHLWPGLLLRLASARTRFMRRLERALSEHRPDAVFVPYPGHLVVRWVRSVFEGPIVLDLFLSAHDTLVHDRRRFGSRSMVAKWLRRVDRRACDAADLVLLDTPQHAQHVAELVDLSTERFGWVPVTDPDAPLIAPGYSAPAPGERLEILFFGTGVPLHGLQHLIQAVQAVPGVRLTLIGGSPRERALARRLPGERIRLREEFVSREELQVELERCHLAAGVFSDGGKAQRVVPFKVVHALAAGRPVLTSDTPAIRRFLSPGKDCLVCSPGDPSSLASALQTLRCDGARLARVARHARGAFDAAFSMDALGEQLRVSLARIGLGESPVRRPLVQVGEDSR